MASYPIIGAEAGHQQPQQWDSYFSNILVWDSEKRIEMKKRTKNTKERDSSELESNLRISGVKEIYKNKLMLEH